MDEQSLGSQNFWTTRQPEERWQSAVHVCAHCLCAILRLRVYRRQPGMMLSCGQTPSRRIAVQENTMKLGNLTALRHVSWLPAILGELQETYPFSRARARSSFLRTLPVAVRGSGPNSTCFGHLKCASRSRHQSCSSSAVAAAPGFRAT